MLKLPTFPVPKLNIDDFIAGNVRFSRPMTCHLLRCGERLRTQACD